MACNTKTLVKVGLAAGAVLAVAYLALPQLRPLISSSSPVLLFLLCPLSMMLMMRGMHGGQSNAAGPEAPKALPNDVDRRSGTQ